jgi:hypothetical protein
MWVGWNESVMLFEWTSNDEQKEFVMPNQKAEEKEEGLN